MNIILFGPPGAGKGTQSDNLVKDFNLHKVSTGDLLRNEIKINTPLGIKIKSIIDKGQLVSDDIIESLVDKILSNKKIFNRLIFDGVPRNLNQVKILNDLLVKHKQKISCVLSLTVDRDTIIKRVLGRQVCSKCGLIFNEFFNKPNNDTHLCDKKYLTKRSDDNTSTIVSRFDTYSKEALPILDFYKKQGILNEIQGMMQIDVIYKEIKAIIQPLATWLYKK